MDVELQSLMDMQGDCLVQPWKTISGMCVLMPKMGVLLHAFRFSGGLQSFASAFVLSMNHVLDCHSDSGLVHGNTCMGNMLIDENQRLHLICHDKARCDELTVRRP